MKGKGYESAIFLQTAIVSLIAASILFVVMSDKSVTHFAIHFQY